ncbi:MAG: RidA family protein [bacterium]|jgi:enamine deaminase RidA (YjgF/YER057c/UK114 family)
MAIIEQRLAELGIELPEQHPPMAHYVSVQREGDLLFLSGAGPLKDGKATVTGRLGENLTVEQGYAAAREAGLSLLATLKRELGDLDRVEQIVKLLGFVASTDDFFAQPSVINGTSDLLNEVFGEKGRHARSAVGTNVLPFRVPVEVEAIVRIRD